jgi:hypothetical protein
MEQGGGQTDAGDRLAVGPEGVDVAVQNDGQDAFFLAATASIDPAARPGIGVDPGADQVTIQRRASA